MSRSIRLSIRFRVYVNWRTVKILELGKDFFFTSASEVLSGGNGAEEKDGKDGERISQIIWSKSKDNKQKASEIISVKCYNHSRNVIIILGEENRTVRFSSPAF